MNIRVIFLHVQSGSAYATPWVATDLTLEEYKRQFKKDFSRTSFIDIDGDGLMPADFVRHHCVVEFQRM